jgi:hypothetical protein
VIEQRENAEVLMGVAALESSDDGLPALVYYAFARSARARRGRDAGATMLIGD